MSETNQSPEQLELTHKVQKYLLDNGYHLTALELCVEAQAGNGQFPELEAFFQDPGHFPPDEIARHAHINALDVQAQAREREQRLQLSEYELRLAREDLADMSRKLAELQASASSQQEQRHGATEQGRAASTASQLSLENGHDTQLQQHQLEQKQQQQQQQQQQQKQQALGKAMGSLSQDATASFDWSTIGEPSASDCNAINSCMVAFMVWQGFKTSALALREEAGCGSAEAGAAGSANHSHHPAQPQQHPGLAVWRWYQLARSPLAQHGLESLAAKASTEAVVAQTAANERAQVEQLKELLGQAQAEAAAARAQADTLAQDAAQLRVKVEALQAAALASGERLKESASTEDLSKSSREAEANQSGAKDPLEQEQLEQQLQQQQHVLVLATIVNQLTELLPRIMPALTIKSRLEMLPMVQTVILATLDPETQRALVGLVFNGVATPDPAQRGAVVGLCTGVASVLGPTWAAQEILSMCTKQVSSPSTERRVLVAEQLHALLNPNEPVPLVDLSVTAHTLLPQLHRLAEDRMEQVREAAMACLVTLLKPNRLVFSRHYYMMLEEVLVQLVQDGSEGIALMAINSFLPALQAWATSGGEGSLLTSSLLPRVVAEAGRHIRLGAASVAPTAAQATGTPINPAYQGSLLAYAPAPDSGGANSTPSPQATKGPAAPAGLLPKGSFGGAAPASATQYNAKRFACYNYQAAHQLLELYAILQPLLRHTALSGCPAWVVAAAAPGLATTSPRKRAESQQGVQDSVDEGIHEDDGGVQGGEQGLETKAPDATAGHIEQPPSGVKHRRSYSVDTPGDGALSGHQQKPSQPPQESGMTTCRSVDGLASGSASGAVPPTPSAASSGSPTWLGVPEAGVELVDAHELVQDGKVELDALMKAWLCSGPGQHMQWKAVQWVLQFLLPELLDSANTLPSIPAPSPTSHLAPTQPTPLINSTTTNNNSHMINPNTTSASADPDNSSTSPAQRSPSPSSPQQSQAHNQQHQQAHTSGNTTSRANSSGEALPHSGGVAASAGGRAADQAAGKHPLDSAWEVRVQLARSLQATVHVFGPAFARSVMLPMCSAAAGACNGGSVPEEPAPQTICFVGESLAPHVQEASQELRPTSQDSARACRERMLPLLLGAVLPACGEGRLSSWMVFVANHASHPTNAWLGQSLQEISKAITFSCGLNDSCLLEVMQVLEHMVGQSAQGISSEMGLLGLAVARGVLPVAGARDHIARRIMPFVMVLLSNGDVDMQLACVGVLLEVLQRYWEDAKLVEQVLVVYDGLLEQSPHEVQCAVLGAGRQLATLVSPKATLSPAAASQLEWLLQASQSMSQQLNSAPDTLEQKRALASQLAQVIHTIHRHDVRLPRLQSALQVCASTLQHSRPLLTDSQFAAVLAVTNTQAAARATPSPGSAAAHQQQQQQAAAVAHQQQVAMQQHVAMQQAQQYQAHMQQQAAATATQQQTQQTGHGAQPQANMDPRVSTMMAQSTTGPLGSVFNQASQAMQASQQQRILQQQQQQQQQQEDESSFSSRFQRFKNRFKKNEPQPGPGQQPPVISMGGSVIMGSPAGGAQGNPLSPSTQQPAVQQGPRLQYTLPQQQAQQQQQQQQQATPALKKLPSGGAQAAQAAGRNERQPSWTSPAEDMGKPGSHFLSDDDDL